MSRRGEALAFSRRVDDLIGLAEHPGRESWSGQGGDGDVTIARLLAALDASRGSRIRHVLRQEICQGSIRTKRVPTGIAILGLLRRPLTMALGAVALVLLILQCSWPGGVKGLVIQVGEQITRAQLGPHLEVMFGKKSIPAPGPQPPHAEESVQEIYSRPGRGGLPDRVGLGVERFSRLVDATRALKGFAPKLPSYIPKGWVFREALVPPRRDSLFLFYMNKYRVIMFSVLPTGDLSAAGGRPGGAGSGWGATEGPGVQMRRISINGHDAAWLSIEYGPNDQDNSLTWEDAGMVFQLEAEGLPLEEVARIAESVR